MAIQVTWNDLEELRGCEQDDVAFKKAFIRLFGTELYEKYYVAGHRTPSQMMAELNRHMSGRSRSRKRPI